jgi:GAF domain-containing protein
VNGTDGLSAEAVGRLADTLAEAARVLFAVGGVDETLRHVVELAARTVEGCDLAAISLVGGARVRSDPLAAELEELQHELGQGPCVSAVAQGGTVYAGDLADDDRWPGFAPVAVRGGVRSVLALPLAVEGTNGWLALYAHLPEAFGALDRGRGQLLVALAGLALSTAQVHEAEEKQAVDLRAALDTREVIGQAQGILIERERISPDQAFDVLRRASQHLNVKLREVARALVETGESPDTGQG